MIGMEEPTRPRTKTTPDPARKGSGGGKTDHVDHDPPSPPHQLHLQSAGERSWKRLSHARGVPQGIDLQGDVLSDEAVNWAEEHGPDRGTISLKWASSAAPTESFSSASHTQIVDALRSLLPAAFGAPDTWHRSGRVGGKDDCFSLEVRYSEQTPSLTDLSRLGQTGSGGAKTADVPRRAVRDKKHAKEQLSPSTLPEGGLHGAQSPRLTSTVLDDGITRTRSTVVELSEAARALDGLEFTTKGLVLALAQGLDEVLDRMALLSRGAKPWAVPLLGVNAPSPAVKKAGRPDTTLRRLDSETFLSVTLPEFERFLSRLPVRLIPQCFQLLLDGLAGESSQTFEDNEKVAERVMRVAEAGGVELRLKQTGQPVVIRCARMKGMRTGNFDARALGSVNVSNSAAWPHLTAVAKLAVEENG